MSENAPGQQPTPTVSIYQNPDHVAGILQQVFVAPLIVAETHEQGEDASRAENVGKQAGGTLAASASIPLVGKIDADLTGQRARNTEVGSVSTTRLSRNYEYSQAYYLYLIRNTLRERGQLKTVTAGSEAAGLEAGDFVEYEATFRPNEISALLDILTPDLIAAITHHHYKDEGIKLFDAYAGDYEALKVFIEKNAAKAENNAVLARAVAEAVRVDFRSEKTREFYGAIGPTSDSVTAITICDHAHFVVEDEDRILDGHFTVLGKVTSPVVRDVPILERNKLLDRLKPEGVDELFDQLRDSVNDKARGIEHLAGTDGDSSSTTDGIVDMALASRIEGSSFKVIPIAIYA